MANIVSIEKLTQAAATYDKVWRTLPYFSLEEVCAQLRMNMVSVKETHILTAIRHSAGHTYGYAPGQAKVEGKKLLDFYQSKLKVERVVCEMYDNVTLYDDKGEIVMKNGKTLDNKTKKDPLEKEIIEAIITSHAEDIVFYMFFAERDPEKLRELKHAFTGFLPQLNILAAGGYISEAEGNLVATGELAHPVDKTDTKAWDEVIKFIRAAHPMLRGASKHDVQLVISTGALFNVYMAFNNKFNDGGKLLGKDMMLETLREICQSPRLVLSSHECFGTGSKMILQKVGNFDFGFDYSKGDKFVDVRNVDRDPNEVQFWLQAGYGTRFQDIHKKVFMTNDKTNTPVDLSGDFKNKVEPVEP